MARILDLKFLSRPAPPSHPWLHPTSVSFVLIPLILDADLTGRGAFR